MERRTVRGDFGVAVALTIERVHAHAQIEQVAHAWQIVMGWLVTSRPFEQVWYALVLVARVVTGIRHANLDTRHAPEAVAIPA